MVDFRDAVETLVNIGFMQVVLPFLLVYAMTYAILQKSKIFHTTEGDSDANHVKNVNAIIAFVFAVFVVASITTVMAIEQIILGIVVVMVFILVVLILMAFIFGEDYKSWYLRDDGKINNVVVALISLLVFFVSLGILFSVLGVWDWIFDFFDSNFSGNGFGDTFTWIVIIVLLGLFIWWIGREDNTNSKSE
jgi:hypothetical protein